MQQLEVKFLKFNFALNGRRSGTGQESGDPSKKNPHYAIVPLAPNTWLYEKFTTWKR